jgi:hypothetical protein
LLLVSGHGAEIIEVGPNEELEVTVFTRSNVGAAFSLLHADHKKEVFIDHVEVKHGGPGTEDEKPTCVIINPNSHIKGPSKVKVKADSHGGRFTTFEYLIVFSFKTMK